MSANRRLLEQFLADGTIDLQKGAIFATRPEPCSPELAWQRLEGLFLGLAIGDALGNTTESMLPQERRRRYGEIRDYLPNGHVDGRCLGLPSNDTQLTFWTLEQLLADGECRPDRVAARFCQGHIYGLGSTVREFLRNYQDKKLPWYRCGPKSAGNGSLMRIAPLILPHLGSATPDL
jgi:ADP-ribosyl-[dinitrogen reductase] hydrolase